MKTCKFHISFLFAVLLIALLFSASAMRAADAPLYIFSGTDQILADDITGTTKSVITAPLAYGGTAETVDPTWSGKVVLVDRGPNSINNKTVNVKAGGGLGIIISNNSTASFSASLGTGITSTIFGVTVSGTDGTKLKAKAGQKVTISSTAPIVTFSKNLRINTKTESYTLALTDSPEDANVIVTIESVAAADWIIPSDVTANFAIGTTVQGASLGTGIVNIKADDAVSLISLGSTRTASKGSTWSAIKLGANRWLITGRLGNDSPIAAVGERVLLVPSWDGNPPVTFQWKKDGQDLAGQTNPALLIQAATTQDAGAYSVLISNEAGSASGLFQLTVNP